jgi:hypothetical protein
VVAHQEVEQPGWCNRGKASRAQTLQSRGTMFKPQTVGSITYMC